jgi:hypothetical protein
MYGDRCSVAHAGNAEVNYRRSAKRCGVDFKMSQWEDVGKLRRRRTRGLASAGGRLKPAALHAA